MFSYFFRPFHTCLNEWLFVLFPEVNSFTFFFVSCHVLFLATGSRINLTIFCMQPIFSHNNGG